MFCYIGLSAVAACPPGTLDRAAKLFKALPARLGPDARAATHKVASSARSA